MKKSNHTPAKRPSMFWFITESGRALAEYALSIPYQKFKASKIEGDGHPILVLPGFIASDTSTKGLRDMLDTAGFCSYAWELGRNKAELENLSKLVNKVKEIYSKHRRKVSIIGHSLGGVYARQIAKAHPEMIRQVITMGSPFKGIDQPNNIAWIYKFLHPGKSIKDHDEDLFEDLPNPAPVPTTSIYSKEDGVVPWQLCLEDEDDIHQNIRVRSSHVGMTVNPVVWDIILDRLLQEEDMWRKYECTSRWRELIFEPQV